MKVKEFNPDEYIGKRLKIFDNQSIRLHELYDVVKDLAPEALINVWWYASGSIELNIIGNLNDVPEKFADAGHELKKEFYEGTGTFKYTYRLPDSHGAEIEFYAVPPNCKLIEKTRRLPAKTQTYYEVECNGEVEGVEK